MHRVDAVLQQQLRWRSVFAVRRRLKQTLEQVLYCLQGQEMRRSKKSRMPDMEIVLDLEDHVVKINGLTFCWLWVEPHNAPRRLAAH
jgi:hypothetical protein